LIVDDDEDLRMALGDVVESLEKRPWLGAASAAEVTRLGPQAVAAGLAIIDINLGAGQPSGLDVLSWLRQNGFQGKAAFLTGHAYTHPDVERARRLQGVPVLRKPVELSVLVDLIKGAP
jgi:FixJ family two-component response regulator